MRKFVLALSAVSLLAGSAGPALAAACRDKSGKFIKCPPKPAKAKTCRDKSGKFIKCK
jgi:hypothetical protein